MLEWVKLDNGVMELGALASQCWILFPGCFMRERNVENLRLSWWVWFWPNVDLAITPTPSVCMLLQMIRWAKHDPSCLSGALSLEEDWVKRITRDTEYMEPTSNSYYLCSRDVSSSPPLVFTIVPCNNDGHYYYHYSLTPSLRRREWFRL